MEGSQVVGVRVERLKRLLGEEFIGGLARIAVDPDAGDLTHPEPGLDLDGTSISYFIKAPLKSDCIKF